MKVAFRCRLYIAIILGGLMATPASAQPIPEVPLTAVDAGQAYAAEVVRDGIAWGELRTGNPNAPVTVIYYASLTCPHCASFHTNTLPDITRDYIQTGKVQFIFRNLVSNQYDLYAAMMARCSGPDLVFPMMSMLLEQQSIWLEGNKVAKLAMFAERGGMNRDQFDTCLTNQALLDHLVEMQTVAIENLGVERTPTFFINGERVEGAATIDYFEAAFANAAANVQ